MNNKFQSCNTGHQGDNAVAGSRLVDISSHRFATRNGVPLCGDLYRPEGDMAVPVVISVHGGTWADGDRATHREWGAYLASHGIALFSIDRFHYAKNDAVFPAVIADFLSAIDFLVQNADKLILDVDRIATMGDSSGAYIASLAGLAGDDLPFDPEGRSLNLRQRVKAIVGIYGIYDLGAEWGYEQLARPFDRGAEWLLGKPLVDDRLLYFRASPIAYATRERNSARIFLTWGTSDEVVSETIHSKTFSRALAQANFFVTEVELPSAKHYWFCDPMDEVLSQSAYLAPRLLRFLQMAFNCA